MNYLRACLLLVVMASLGLFAGIPETIEKDSELQKQMELTVTHKDGGNANNVQITVTFKGHDNHEVNLVNQGKYKNLATKVKEGKVSASFEIEKQTLVGSTLSISIKRSFSWQPQPGCLPSYSVSLADFVN